MPINIPMPRDTNDILMQGFHSINDIIQQSRQAALARQQMEEQKRQHIAQMEMQKAAAARAAQFDPLRMQLLTEQVQHAKNANDPMYEINQFKAMQNMMSGNGNAEQQEDLIGSLKQNPILRGFFHRKFGYDPLAPLAQTPEQKQQAALDLFNKKEAIKLKNKTGINTNAVITKSQNVINGITNAMPIIDRLILDTKSGETPGQLFGKYFSPNKQATYESTISESAETLANALGYPNTEGGFHQAEKVVARRNGESDSHYISRLEDLKRQLGKRKTNAVSVLQPGTSLENVMNGPLEDFSHMSDDELRKIAQGGR